jgi:mitogen-activated protein kinase 1/3
LVNSTCIVKICDFGLSRPIIENLSDKKNIFTEYIATRWYRAPEVLLSWAKYSKAVDMWSVGCIFAELILRKPIFQGEDSIYCFLLLVTHQIELIIDLIGTPSMEEIYQISTTKTREIVFNFGNNEPKKFQDVFHDFNPLALDLLSKMLVFNPQKRITVEEALEHPFMKELHVPDDEPTSEPVSKFDFLFEEDEDNSVEDIKSLILDEVMLYVNPQHYENYIFEKKEYVEKIKRSEERRKTAKYMMKNTR